MRRFLIILGFLMSVSSVAWTQEAKEVILSSETPYDENVEVSCDEKGLIMNLRMIYDEDNDLLSLSLVPSRPVIFYRKDVTFKDVFSSGKVLKTERFPYAVQVSPASTFKLKKSVFKRYPKKRKEHIYNRWLGNVSSGIVELCPEVTEAGEAVPLVTTDSLFLRFKVNPSVSKAAFKIRNVQTVDLVKKNKKGKAKYSITGEADLNTTYNITFQRNPCCGMSSLKEAVCNQIQTVSNAYHNLLQACPDGVAFSQEELSIFNEHRKFLEAQYPFLNIDTECQDIRVACDKYNSYVDSIRNAPCNLIIPNETIEDFFVEEGRIASDVLVNASRRLNSMAIKMLTVKDEVEKRDVYYQGKVLIDDMTNNIKHNGVSGEDREQAKQLFSEAVDFWHKSVAKIHY